MTAALRLQHWWTFPCLQNPTATILKPACAIKLMTRITLESLQLDQLLCNARVHVGTNASDRLGSVSARLDRPNFDLPPAPFPSPCSGHVVDWGFLHRQRRGVDGAERGGGTGPYRGGTGRYTGTGLGVGGG